MTRRLGASLTGGLSLLAFASAFGCEAQVNDEYTGEPLLSLQGNVLVSAEQADSDLVPRVAFLEDGGADDDTVVMIDGELSGEFPAKFRFDVTQPPPDTALYGPTPEIGMNSRYAVGFLVLRPSDSESRITAYLKEPEPEEQCTDDGSQCTRVERKCDDADRCRERTLECAKHPCELIEQLGDPTLGLTTTGERSEYCDSESCYAVQSACDDQGVNCRTDIYRCDFAQYGEFETAWDGVMTTCTVQSESGDPSLVDLDILRTVVVDYALIYATDDNPDSVYGSLKRGYNLVTGGPTEAFLERERCRVAKLTAAVDEYNEEHGTELLPFGDDAELIPLGLAAAKECAGSVVIAQPLDEVLTLELGKYGQNAF